MKIVTVNVPESYIDAINKLIGENGLYPSRSELIRCAVRDFLLKELKAANNITRFNNEEYSNFDDENYVRVPIEKLDENSEPITEFKTYKIIKKLDSNKVYY
jgi:Arc/MetJ-type ribon-helix-helix transcriptional regulator